MKLSVLGMDLILSSWFWIYVAVFTWRNLAEWRLTRGRAGGEPGKRTGSGTLGLFVVAYFGCGLGTGFWLLRQNPSPFAFALGCVGFLLLHRVRSRVLARQLTLGWNPYTTPRADSHLVTRGAYAWVRHPLYLINCLELACLCLVLPNPVALAAWLLDLGATLWRIPGEEYLLGQRYGAAWEAYRTRTKKLVPFLY